jgi:multidrug efflux system outer membrane protein
VPAALFIAVPATAAPWTLERVLAAVRADDPVIAAARAGADAARAEASAGRFAFSPRVTLQAGATRGDDPALMFTQKLWQGRFTAQDLALPALNQPPAATGLHWGLVIEQPLWNGGRELTSVGLASRRRRAARAAGEAAVAARLLEAVETYAGAARARAAEAADSAGLVAAESYREAAVGRLRMGQVSPLDSMRAAARAGEARLRWLASRQAADLSLKRLSALVGVPVARESLALPGDTPDSPSAAAPAPRAELVAARETAAAMGSESRQAGLSLLPALNSRFTVTRYRDANLGDWEPRWTAAVLLELPLWDGARRVEDWSAARARAREARARAAALERDLALDLEAARSEAALSDERRAVARDTDAAAGEALRFATERYRAGLLPLTELLATDAEAARARLARVEAETQALVAHYRLVRARGELR